MEFLESYEKMIQEAYIELECSLKYKLKAIKECQTQLCEYEKKNKGNHEHIEYKIKMMDLDKINKEVNVSNCESLESCSSADAH